jgi:hypothetical protein
MRKIVICKVVWTIKLSETELRSPISVGDPDSFESRPFSRIRSIFPDPTHLRCLVPIKIIIFLLQHFQHVRFSPNIEKTSAIFYDYLRLLRLFSKSRGFRVSDEDHVFFRCRILIQIRPKMDQIRQHLYLSDSG